MGDKKWRVVFGDIGGLEEESIYNQRVTIFSADNEVIGIYKGSSTPNPFKPSDPSIAGENAYPYIKKGNYVLTHGTHKGKPALVVNHNGFVPTNNKNPNFPDYGKQANFIHVHWGYKTTWKGSAGCPTIHPGQWKDFLSKVPSGVGVLVIP